MIRLDRRLLALALAASLIPVSAAAGADKDERPFEEQTTVFRRLLSGYNLQALTGFEQIDSQTILIILGDLRRLDELTRVGWSLHGFLAAGGAVLLATDQPVRSPHLIILGVQPGQGVPHWTQAQVNDQHFYGGWAWCPKVQPLPVGPPAPVLFQPPLPVPRAMLPAEAASLLRPVATNRPGYLEITDAGLFRQWGLHELAHLPSGCTNGDRGWSLDQRRRFRWYSATDVGRAALTGEKGGWQGPLFAVGGEVEENQGRLVLLADQSIFSNGMIYRQDNGNMEFTGQTLHWLQGDPKHPRTKALLVDNGEIRTHFEVRLRSAMPMPKPSQEVIVAAVDETLAHMEDRDALNDGVLDMLNSWTPYWPRRLTRWAFLGLTLLTFLYAAYRIGIHGRHRRDQAVPLLSHALAEHRQRGSLLEQRQEALEHLGNAWEVARSLARECFADLAPEEPGASPPRFLVPGKAWQRWRRCRRLRWLWRLAYDPAPLTIAPEKLPALLAELQQVAADREQGIIRIA